MLSVWKKEGELLSELLERVRREHPETGDEPLSYAGRLDPLAEGEMIILVGEEENRNREQYLGLDKVYKAEILFGVETDTYDILGIPTTDAPRDITQEEIERVVSALVGTHEFSYPPYSSKVVDGTPLWKHAREGTLEEIDIPTRTMEIHEATVTSCAAISQENILERVKGITEKVNGDFRQEEIRTSWKMALLGQKKHSIPVWNDSKKPFHTCGMVISCGSGTYIRSIAHELGKRLGTGACVYRLRRTQIRISKTKS